MKLLQLHIPEEFHKELKQEALNQNMSLKDLVISALEPLLKTKHPKATLAVIELTKLANEAIEEQATPTEIFNGLTCRGGHPSKDGKSCMNMKCAYFK